MAHSFEDQSLIETSLEEITDDLMCNRITKFEAKRREGVLLVSFEDNIVPSYLICKDVVRKLQTMSNGSFLFSSDCDHVSTARSEKKFSCGYKNFQILLSALLKSNVYREVLKNDIENIPTIWKIQALFEQAWKKGFDPNGAVTFDQKIYDTKKKIGVCDIAFVLASLRIRCKINDYSSFQSKESVRKRMIDDLQNHFNRRHQDNADPYRACFPLIFQSERHSKTMIGIQKSLNTTNGEMIILEPGIPKNKMENILHNPCPPYQLLQHFNKEQYNKYQILFVTGVIESADEFDVKKTQLDIEMIE